MKKPLLVILLFVFPVILSAQIEAPGAPRSLGLRLKSIPESITFPGLSKVEAAKYISTISPALKPMIFAYPFNTDLSADRDGTWETLKDGSSIWRLTVCSPDALSLNLIFSRFSLPPGASVYLYTPDYRIIHGAFISDSQSSSGELATAPLQGDRITVELNLPANPEFKPELEISQVSHDFKGFFELSAIEKSGSCNVDINCSAGAAWQTEKRAVVKFIRGGVWLCSGALINNTRNDGKALLLTANHTIGNENHAINSVFFFKYERPTCGSGTGTYLSLSGSKLLATTDKVDFSLVELSTPPPKNYEPYYAGWDRKIYSYLDTVSCIHHPNGDVKKISKSFHRVLTADFGGGYDTNTHWKISAWNIGTTEPGSSGSPLFNTDHRIVGDLTGGDANCDSNFNDYFQKLSVSWDKYPDSSDQLKHWLDPDETGALVVNGYDPYAGGKPLANFTIRPDNILVGRKVYFNDLSTGLPNTWKWSFDNGTPSVSSLQIPGAVKFNIPGTYHVTLTITNNLGTDSLKQTIIVSENPVNIISENRIVEGRQVTLTDQSSGTPTSLSWSVTGPTSAVYSGNNFELSFLNQGDYSVKEVIQYPDLTDTLIHYNQIRVIPDVIAFRSYTFNNVAGDEHTGYLKMGQQGYIPGSNSQGITAYAQEFRNSSDSVFIIQGITVSLALRSNWTKNYYLPIVFWNSKKQQAYKDSILINNFQAKSRFTKWLRSPVNFDTLMYVGFEVRPWDQGTFVSKMATDRGTDGKSNAFIVNGNQWQGITDYAGVHTSLDLALETSVYFDAFKEEIKILPNYNSGTFTLDLGSLVFKTVDISVYNVKGQKVLADVTKMSNQVSFQIIPPVAGVYVVRLLIDKYQFAVKVMILR
jgi:PKD repeat protein